MALLFVISISTNGLNSVVLMGSVACVERDRDIYTSRSRVEGNDYHHCKPHFKHKT